MQYPSAYIALFAATAVLSIPVPLNINMGAYSPALVVGDGAIGFKGTESVTQIMNTLEGAAASGAATNGAANAAPAAAAAPAATQAGITQAGVTEQAPATNTAPEVVPQGELPQGMGKNVVTARDEEELDLEELYTEVAKRLTPEEEIEIDEEVEEEDAEKKVKRDLAGFNAALNYAAGALKTSPEVQLGTGEGGSGVGITVNPSSNTTRVG
ncbi:uncharacterized protein LY89DRAFT_491658 [Mollisia scopiformis]|uniref:Uncharacterized protein n=1 Tax=Mollisia scopiformis TaxID=149040 RepID=A0A194XH00_MOLSC|nr:uncharacterized protein LY89DRAFT_491658 [Mollisia scopiformis]KUJ19480.1 hypothetical protein LY89DRAFT_491658 [Mollisia scopiformis]